MKRLAVALSGGLAHRKLNLLPIDYRNAVLITAVLIFSAASCGPAPRPDSENRSTETSTSQAQTTKPKPAPDAKALEPRTTADAITLAVPEMAVGTVAFSPNGELLAVAGQGGDVILWDTTTHERRFALPGGPEDVVFDLYWSPDGSRLFSFAFLGTMRMWDIETRQPVEAFQPVKHSMYAGAWSLDGSRMAMTDGKDVRLCDPETGAELHRLKGHEEFVDDVKFSRDARRLASGASDNTVRIWDVETREELQKLPHREVVKCVAWSPDGRYVAGGLYGIYVWEVESGRRVHEFRGPTRSVIFSHDGKYVATGTDREVKLWDMATGKAIRTFTGHTDEIFGLDFSPDGRCLASASYDHSVKLWDVTDLVAPAEADTE